VEAAFFQLEKDFGAFFHSLYPVALLLQVFLIKSPETGILVSD